MKEFIEKLIDRLEEESDYKPIDYDYCDMSCSDEEHFISTHKAIQIVSQLAEEYLPDTNVGNKDGWIPVEERLPDNNEPVLCWVKSTTIASGETYIIGSCSNKCWFLQTYEIGHHYFPVKDYEVAAWQPLPEPYRKESKKDD